MLRIATKSKTVFCVVYWLWSGSRWEKQEFCWRSISSFLPSKAKEKVRSSADCIHIRVMLNFSHFHLRNHVMIIIMFTVKPLSWRTDFTTNPACQSPLFKDEKYTSRSPTCPNCPEILVQAWKFVFFVICISHRALKVSKGTNHNYSCSFAHYTKEMLFLLLFLSNFV